MDNKHDGITKLLAQALCKGCKSTDIEVQTLVRQHYEIIKAYWVPTRESYKGLANLYREDPSFRDYYESRGVRPVEFLVEAMYFFADNELE